MRKRKKRESRWDKGVRKGGAEERGKGEGRGRSKGVRDRGYVYGVSTNYFASNYVMSL